MPGGLPDVEQRFSAESSGYSAAIAAMIRDNQALIKSVGDAQRQIRELGGDLGALGDRRIRVEVVGAADAIAQVAALKKELDGLGDRTVHIGGDNGAMLRELRDISASMDMVSSSLGRMEDHMVVMKRDLADSSADLQMQTQMLRDNADAHNAAANAVSTLNAARQGGGGGTYVRAGGGGGTGGGAAGTGGGSHGGGSGGLPGGAGAFVPWRGGGFAAIQFWTSALAEFAATAVPALLAGGAATLVGLKGAQDVVGRGQAIAAASASIGPAFGQTLGGYLGTSGSLGRQQAAARGGVYELAGDAIGFANAGKGTFGQAGISTLSMIDRGTANMLLNYKARQAGGGGAGGGIVADGTNWLRKYGDLGSNIGDAIMNMAPYEPGIGGDVLQGLVGITGAAKQVTQDLPGPLIGAIMAVEGGHRWGNAVLGGDGLLGRALGLGKVGGVGGLIGKAGGALAEKAPLGSALEGAGFDLAALGGGLAEFSNPISIGAALTGYEISALSNYKDSAQQHIGALQTQVGNAGFSAAFKPLAQAIATTTGLGGAVQGLPGAGTAVVDGRHLPGGRVGTGIQAAQAIGDKNQFTAAATGFTQTMGDLVGSGPQLVSALKKAGLKGVGMADAFQIAQNALLDLPHAFGKDGKLNATALQMVESYGAAIKPMTQSAGGFNAAIAAQQIASSPQMKSLSQVNQAMDTMTQVMTGGPAGMATLIGMLGGTPATVSHGGVKIAASPAMKQMAQALGSFTTTSGASAWNTFAGSSGLVSAEQQNLDQLRTYMTLGALPLQGKGGAQGIAGFQLEQLLPMASKSPAALAMLMQQGSQMGVGSYYDPSKSLKENLKDAEKSFTSMAGSAAQVNKGMTNAVVASSNLPATASKFTQGVSANLESKSIAAASADLANLRKQAQKGLVDQGALKDLQAQFSNAGLSIGNGLKNSIDASLKQAGVGQAMRVKIEAQMDVSQAKAAIANLTHVAARPKVTVQAVTSAAQAAIDAIKGKDVPVTVKAQGISAIQSAIDSLHGKTVTVTTVNRLITQVIGMGTPAGGVAPATLAGGPANMRITAGAQTGRKIPGYGGGDVFGPIMVEPGELILPKHASADPMAAALAAKYRIPGYADGGFVGQQVFGPLAYRGAGSGISMFNPAMYAQIIAAMNASQGIGAFMQPQGTRLMPGMTGAAGGGPSASLTSSVHTIGSKFSVEVLKGMKDGIKNAGPEAQALAKALVAKVQQEVSYAKNVSSQMQQGVNLGGMDVTPGTGNGTVQEQMQSYLSSEKSFNKDLGTLRKGHLNKDLVSQLVGAGPVQGDALAQSILSGPGGIKGANKLDNSIAKLAKSIGAQAAMAQYGGHLSPNLKDATVVGKGGVAVSISVNAGGGGKGGGDLELTKSQIASIVAQVQAALLKQSKRNTKTGVKLPGKSS